VQRGEGARLSSFPRWPVALPLSDSPPVLQWRVSISSGASVSVVAHQYQQWCVSISSGASVVCHWCVSGASVVRQWCVSGRGARAESRLHLAYTSPRSHLLEIMQRLGGEVVEGGRPHAAMCRRVLAQPSLASHLDSCGYSLDA